MINVPHSLMLIAVISLVTAITRFLPFIIFGSSRKMSRSLEYLGRVLPGAIMGMLAVYCFRSTAVTVWPFGLPELAATAAVVILYLWKHNTLLAIGAGTVLYMILVQAVFV